MMNINGTQNQKNIMEEMDFIFSDNALLENISVEDMMKISLKAIEEVNNNYNESILNYLKKFTI